MKRSLVNPDRVAILPGVLCVLLAACSPTKPLPPPADLTPRRVDRPMAFDHSHKQFDRLLSEHVIDGWVDYQGIIAKAPVFYNYLQALAGVNADIFNTWTREQQLAFWINAYNAFTIQAVIERYPIAGRSLIGLFFPKNSILQIPGIWTRLTFRAAGKHLTLGQIEHDIIRKKFNEPRIHFAIVCASRSCPALRSEAYRATILQRQLDSQTIGFINDPQRGMRWNAAAQRLYISKIFKWFRTDFQNTTLPKDSPAHSQRSKDPLLAFVQPYLNRQPVINALADGRDIRVSYLAYDWRLNDLADKPSPPPEDAGNDG